MKKFIFLLLITLGLFAQSEPNRPLYLSDSTSTYFTQDSITVLLAAKFDISDTTNLDKYTQAEIDSIIALYYPQTEVDSLLNLHYTITQVDSILNLHYTSSEVDSIFALYYTKTEIDLALQSYYTKTESDSIKAVFDGRIDSTITNVAALEDSINVHRTAIDTNTDNISDNADSLAAHRTEINANTILLNIHDQTLTYITADTTKWNDAHSWGDHSTVGYYLASDTTKLDKYTQEEVNTLLNEKSDTNHLHDDRYYTETETNNFLDAKSDTGHTHNQYLDNETDPLWTSDKPSYATKTNVSDSVEVLREEFKDTHFRPSLVSFDGVDDYYTTNYVMNTGEHDYSIVLDVFFSSGSSTYTLVDSRDAFGDGFLLQLSSGTLNVHHNALQTTAIYTFTSNTWYHIAVSVEYGSVATIYINGSPVSYSAQPTINTAIATTTKARLGAGSYNPSSHLNGKMGSVLFYNRALTATEGTSLYNYGHPELYSIPNADRGASQTALTSGTLTIGKRYRINTYVAGDDFTNVGGTNVTGNEFVATGTTPTTWTNSSSLAQIGAVAEYYAQYANSYTWQDVSGNESHATGAGSPIVVKARGVEYLPTLVYKNAITGNTTLTNAIPNGYEVVDVDLTNTTANAVTLSLGDIASGTNILNGYALGASSSISKASEYLNRSGSVKSIYISSSNWNSSNITAWIWIRRKN